MKILMLGWELPPHNSGGLGVACYQLCKQLALEGTEIDFVVPYEADHPETAFMRVIGATKHSPEVLRTATLGAYNSISYEESETKTSEMDTPGGLRWQQQRYLEFIKHHTKRNRYQVIHSHDWLTLEAGLIAKAILRRPLVAHVHATEFDRAGGNAGNPLVHEIEYNGLMMADQVLAVSQATKDLLVKRYQIPSSKIGVAHNSLDISQFADLPTENTYEYLSHMKQKGYKVVVSMGRLTIQKGLEYLLEAMKLVVANNNKVLLVLAGDGEQYQELIERAAHLGIAKNVLFTGFVRGKAWRDIYDIGDMFVMPSVSEPFGLTALEAAGHGNGVLISKQSGAGEVLNNVLRFDYWDTHLLASQILAFSEQAGLASVLTENLAHEFAQLSWEKTARQCKELYQRLHTEALAV